MLKVYVSQGLAVPMQGRSVRKEEKRMKKWMKIYQDLGVRLFYFNLKKL